MAREYQGEGRHDAPDHYGALYLAESPVSAIAEQLARFRGRRFRPEMLIRRGHRLALVRCELDDRCELIDLDDPRVLVATALRPSQVATRERRVTQRVAGALFIERPNAHGLRWWSTLEASWINVTLAAERVRRGDLRVGEVAALTLDLPALDDACRVLGLM